MNKIVLVLILYLLPLGLYAKHLTIYTLESCNNCGMALSLLEQSKISFLEKSLTQCMSDQTLLLQNLSVKGIDITSLISMPVVEINGKYLIGIQALKTYLQLKNLLHGNSTVDEEPEDMKGITERHNYWRSEKKLAPLVWSKEVGDYAQEWANAIINKYKGELTHRGNVNNNPKGYGENLYAQFWSGSKPADMEDNGKAVDDWADEKQYYKEGVVFEKSCQGGVCGHYTQIMWEKSTKLGCGKASGIKDQWQMEVFVCNYDPPGNYIGEVPYKVK